MKRNNNIAGFFYIQIAVLQYAHARYETQFFYWLKLYWSGTCTILVS